MLGFVGYQLWGTGIETARAQADLRERLDDRFTSTVITADRVDSEAASAPTTIAPSTGPSTTESTSVATDEPAIATTTEADDPRPEESRAEPFLPGDAVDRDRPHRGRRNRR